MQLKPLEAGGRGGGHGVGVFLCAACSLLWSVVVFLPRHIFSSIMLEWYVLRKTVKYKFYQRQ